MYLLYTVMIPKHFLSDIYIYIYIYILILSIRCVSLEFSWIEVSGKRLTNFHLTSQKRPSVTSCAVMCQGTALCTSFNYQRSNSACKLSSQATALNSSVIINTNWCFWVPTPLRKP